MKYQCCRNCIFLRQNRLHEEGGETYYVPYGWTEAERAKLKPENYPDPEISLSCHKGIWDRNIEEIESLPTLLLQDRKGKCFFFPYEGGAGMFFKAAEELESRKFAYEHLRVTRLMAVTVIIITLAPMIYSLLF